MDLNAYQSLIKKLYFKKDCKRGIAQTFNWFIEEAGELSRALRKGDPKNIREEFADCLAWLLSLGSLLNIDAETAMKKYLSGCPKCHKNPCVCNEEKK